MTRPLLNFEEVRFLLKQRFPMLMIDCVVGIESQMTGAGLKPGEFLGRGTINSMRFPAPVIPSDRMENDVKALKLVQDLALVEGAVTVDGTLGFARRSPQPAKHSKCNGHPALL